MNQEILAQSSTPEHWLHWTFLCPDLLKKPLRTTEGEAVTIIDPGRLNYDNGPDILNAQLVIGGVLQRGDVEFHLTPEDWFRHGHHEDRRYGNLILHVVWEASSGIRPLLQQRFPHLILQHQIRVPLALWREKMLSFEQNESDHSESIPEVAALTPALLINYGQRRFRRKVERFKYWLQQFSFEDVLIISLAEALGYSKNKFPFRQLLWENPPSQIFGLIPRLYCSPVGIWTFLAIKADFLTTQSFSSPPGRSQRPNPPSFLLEEVHRSFLYFSENGVLPALQLSDWYFSRLRPANNPIIRSAALAQILFRYRSPSLFQKMLQIARERSTLEDLLANWQATFQFPFQRQLSNALKALFNLSVPYRQALGTARIRQFLVNAVLPLIYIWAERSGNHGFQQYIEGLYEGFPGCEDTRLIKRFSSLRSDFGKFAIYQQGLLEYISQRQSRNQQLLPYG